MTNLTDLETQVLKSFLTNYDNAEIEKQDNYTYTDMTDIKEATGLAANTIKGVIGSLTKKDLVVICEATFEAPQCFALSHAGIDAYYELKE
jgi:predicted transcriptional regulator